MVEGDEATVLVPRERYAQMNNVYCLPSVAALTLWLEKVGFTDVRCVDIDVTSTAEQRATDLAHDHVQFKASSHYTDSVSLGVTVETNGPEHIDRILDAMRAAGFRPKRIY